MKKELALSFVPWEGCTSKKTCKENGDCFERASLTQFAARGAMTAEALALQIQLTICKHASVATALQRANERLAWLREEEKKLL